MRNICKTLSVLMIGTFLATGSAIAQDHHDDRRDDHRNDRRDDHRDGGYVRHNDWHRGGRINRNDWNRGQQIDWRTRHLQAPRRGYEWRQVDGNYVLAAAATGIIAATIIAASH